MPPVSTQQQTTYTCLEHGCEMKVRRRGVANLKEQGYWHLVIDHSSKYRDTPTFQQHYRTYFRLYYKIR